MRPANISSSVKNLGLGTSDGDSGAGGAGGVDGADGGDAGDGLVDSEDAGGGDAGAIEAQARNAGIPIRNLCPVRTMTSGKRNTLIAIRNDVSALGFVTDM